MCMCVRVRVRVHPFCGSNAPENPLLVTLTYYLMQWDFVWQWQPIWL